MKTKIWSIFGLAAFVIALALPARAENTLPASLDALFAHGVKFTVSGYTNANGTARSTPLQNFPVLVQISETAIPGFDYDDLQSKSTGADIAFIDMSGASLPFDIDEWHPDGASLAWVKLPVLTNGTEFVMCYGSVAVGKFLNADNPFSGYVGVWHMSEASGSVADASGNGLDADPKGTTANSIAVEGKVGKARQNAVSGSSGNLTVPSYSSVYNGTAFTASGWFYQTAYNDNDSRLFSRKSNYNIDGGWETFTKTVKNTPRKGGKLGMRGYTNNNNKTYQSKSDVDLKAMGWTHLAFAYNGATATMYTNGVAVVSEGSIVTPTEGNANALGIGNYNNGTGNASFFGYIDECRLLKATASDDWVWAEYAGMSDSTFLTAGTVQEYEVPDDPFADLVVSSVQYTNATATVMVMALGGNATEAHVTVEFATDDAFESIVKTETLTVSTVGLQTVSATGLSYGSTYYVRAALSNDDGDSLALGPVSFTTLTPGSPVGTASLASPGYTMLHATAIASDFGIGAETATMRLEASTSSDFASVIPGTEVDATLNAETALSVSGLAPDSSYYLRVRILNCYGIDTFVMLPPTRTRAEPFAATGLIFAEGAGGSIDFTFPIIGVYDGATVEAVLTYDNAEIGTRTCTAAETLSWTGVAAASGTATATVVATAMLPNDGGTLTKTWTVSVVPGATATTVTDVSTYASAANALWVRPGDVVVLPEAVGNVSYQVLNERFASVEGNTLTALEPGIVGVRCVDAFFNTNIMGVVILPNAIGSGSVYVYDETKFTEDSWTKAASWKKVDGNSRSAAASNDSWPKNADDIAILPFYNRTGQQCIRHRADITVGGLYTGMIRPEVQAECVLERYKDDATKTVTFRRTDGKPVRVQICPNGYHGTYQSQLRLGGYVIDVVWACDAVIDCGSSETDHTSGPVGTFNVPNTTPYCTNTLLDVTLTVQGLPGRYLNGSGATREFHGIWKGSGTIVKKGQGGIAFQGDLGGFSGSFVLKGEKNLGGIAAPASQLLIRGGGATNVSATVYGVVEVNSNGGITQNNAAGLFGTSAQVGAAPPITDAAATFNGEPGPRGPDAPAKGLSLFGGTWYAGRIDNKTWGVGVCDNKVLDELHIGAGCSVIVIQGANGNNNGYPINVITAKSLRQTDRGTFAVNEGTRQKQTPPAVTNSLFFVENWADYATGADGNSFTSSVHPIIPWMISPMNSDWSNVAFASFDEDGRLLYEVRDNCQITLAPSEDANLYMTSKNLNYGTAGGDYTINSLYLSNGSNNRWLGEGRTLRIKSGGLILQGQSAIGMPGRTDNGALVLGDTTHPAYVWAKAVNASTNYLGAAVTAAGGFVSAYPGNLCLVGDQTGIADEIAVNAGTLAIGTDTADCSIAVGIPIRVCAGAKLLLPTTTNAVAASSIKLDGAGKNSAKVILPVNQTCASLAVRDVYESDEWTTLPSGTYGSSESAAEFVRDDLFVGPGVLTVGEAKARGVLFLVY